MGAWLAELGNLRREVLQLEPLNEQRKQLLHTLATREVCGFDACPSRAPTPASTPKPIPGPPAMSE